MRDEEYFLKFNSSFKTYEERVQAVINLTDKEFKKIIECCPNIFWKIHYSEVLSLIHI